MVKGGYKEPWNDHDRQLMSVMYKAAQSMLSVYAQAGFCVVIDYVFERDELLDFLNGVSIPIPCFFAPRCFMQHSKRNKKMSSCAAHKQQNPRRSAQVL